MNLETMGIAERASQWNSGVVINDAALAVRVQGLIVEYTAAKDALVSQLQAEAARVIRTAANRTPLNLTESAAHAGPIGAIVQRVSLLEAQIAFLEAAHAVLDA